MFLKSADVCSELNKYQMKPVLLFLSTLNLKIWFRRLLLATPARSFDLNVQQIRSFCFPTFFQRPTRFQSQEVLSGQ